MTGMLAGCGVLLADQAASAGDANSVVQGDCRAVRAAHIEMERLMAELVQRGFVTGFEGKCGAVARVRGHGVQILIGAHLAA